MHPYHPWYIALVFALAIGLQVYLMRRLGQTMEKVKVHSEEFQQQNFDQHPKED